MENAAYIGLSRQMTLRRELDIAANNIANADTTGFKAEQLLLGTEVGSRARNDSVRPGVSFVLDKGVGRDFSQGTLEQTGRDLDFAIDGEGAFFKIQDGANEAYTRDGAFTISPEGELVTKAGLPVLGEGGPIVIDPARGPITVADDGNISQNGIAIGQLGLARFDNLAVLSKEGDGLYRNASNATPIDATGAQVRQGMLEGSNVNPLVEITQLIEISRAYERASKMIENVSDLSRRAVERLGKSS
ncbi:MAG: flagellar basal-body rod protein FlgF [Brevundimonas subvibrioides]|uniref:Flagellar basal-body rod protein FlgF n=1 Tax=Brevundimonas subvibrioides TaxID=74313 RepID=A0A258HRB0_9CAUL|nr:flagellar basal-body rod protein FlgF [Brevundimonas subvibrioides]OYX58863.1 MAG: flagellar basal-body rod protein FlgF [Brevundimonas subvibrioides]